MFTRRYRKCCCMDNSGCNEDKEMLEDKCDNICSCNCENHEENECECGFDEEPSVFPANPMLAQSYVPIQTMDKTFTPCCGLKMGTIFPELVSPYAPCQSIEEINYLKKSNEIGEGCNS